MDKWLTSENGLVKQKQTTFLYACCVRKAKFWIMCLAYQIQCA